MYIQYCVYLLVGTHINKKKEMNKILLALLIAISFVNNSSGQTRNNDCDKVLNKEIELNNIKENIESFKIDFKTMMLCKFDTIDYQIMNGPKGNMVDFAIEMLSYLNDSEKEKKYTFSDIFNGIEKFKKTEEYKVVRNIVETRNKLVNKNAYLSEWEEDEKMLETIGFIDEQIEIVKRLVEKNEGETYDEILEIAYPILIEKDNRNDSNDVQVTLMTNPIMTCKNVIELWKGAYTFKSYSECLDCSKKINKPILFFFTGYGCVECMEFMANILTQPEIKSIIDTAYAYITFATDAVEKIETNEVYFSKFQKKDIKTEGDRNLDIQLENFNNIKRPFIVIVSQEGEILRSYNDRTDLAKFKDFLNE